MAVEECSGRGKPAWVEIVARYHRPNTALAVGQIANSLLPCLAGLVLMFYLLRVHYGLVFLTGVVTGGFVIRMFIIQHDCGHGSFLKSGFWNDAVGTVLSLFTLTPYLAWRHDHAVHHATAGNLEGRGVGDIRTMTVAEYEALPRWRRFWYRVYRNPLVLFGIGPTLYFVVGQRLTFNMKPRLHRERRNVFVTNLVLAVAIGAITLWLGWRPVVAVYFPVILTAASVGVWLFYVQHQYDEAYWVHEDEWDYYTAAIHGSSYYRLPKLLQWFTGNIGLHHIHHLSPRIPNYLLQRCHDENPIFHRAHTLTLWSSLKTIPLALYDQEARRLISFREYRRRRPRVARLDKAA